MDITGGRMHREVVIQPQRAFPFYAGRLLIDDDIAGIEAAVGGAADLVRQILVVGEKQRHAHAEEAEWFTLQANLVVGGGNVVIGLKTVWCADVAGLGEIKEAEQAERTRRKLTRLVTVMEIGRASGRERVGQDG